MKPKGSNFDWLGQLTFGAMHSNHVNCLKIHFANFQKQKYVCFGFVKEDRKKNSVSDRIRCFFGIISLSREFTIDASSVVPFPEACDVAMKQTQSSNNLQRYSIIPTKKIYKIMRKFVNSTRSRVAFRLWTDDRKGFICTYWNLSFVVACWMQIIVSNDELSNETSMRESRSREREEKEGQQACTQLEENLHSSSMQFTTQVSGLVVDVPTCASVSSEQTAAASATKPL